LKLVFVLSFVGLSLQARKGVLELDDVSWSRIVDGSKNVFIAFVEHSWKDPTDFEKVAEEFKDTNVIIAKVDCSSNEDLKKKYDVTNYPSFRFFPQGSKDAVPLIYTGAEKPEEINDFIRVQLNPKLSELKALAAQFVASSGDRASINRKVENIVNGLTGSDQEYGKIYLNNFKKILEKGDEFIKAEKDRLTGLIENKSTTGKKKSEFTKRLNILNAFVKTEVL